jgi:hypothetical protein
VPDRSQRSSYRLTPLRAISSLTLEADEELPNHRDGFKAKLLGVIPPASRSHRNEFPQRCGWR